MQIVSVHPLGGWQIRNAYRHVTSIFPSKALPAHPSNFPWIVALEWTFSEAGTEERKQQTTYVALYWSDFAQRLRRGLTGLGNRRRLPVSIVVIPSLAATLTP